VTSLAVTDVREVTLVPKESRKRGWLGAMAHKLMINTRVVASCEGPGGRLAEGARVRELSFADLSRCEVLLVEHRSSWVQLFRAAGECDASRCRPIYLCYVSNY
jgi:hypothetical protein